LYKRDPQIKEQVRQLMALPFLPMANIRLVFNTLRNVADQRLAPLFLYYSRQWMHGIPLSMWCVRDGNIRTTNNLEGWHNRFARAVRRRHANIWLLLTKIREEQASTEVTIQQIVAGRKVTRRKPFYKQSNKRISRLRRQFARNQLNSFSFLNGISYNLKV
jgi:hypothetical protein